MAQLLQAEKKKPIYSDQTQRYARGSWYSVSELGEWRIKDGFAGELGFP